MQLNYVLKFLKWKKNVQFMAVARNAWISEMVYVFIIILILKITREDLEKDYTFEGYTVYCLLFPTQI